MGTLEDAGIRVQVGPGWEAQIRTRTPGVPMTGHAKRVQPPAVGGAVLHVANFALPKETGDFGGGAVELMAAKHVLVNLVEYDDASKGTALFAATGIPVIRPSDFDPATMQRTVEGQAGLQRFFTANGRPFCLYVVLGSHLRRFRTAPVVTEVLRGVQFTDA